MPTSHVLRIGREPDNDFVVNLATVSGYHARVTWSGRPGEAIIEDIGSTNGTAVGSLDRRATRASFTAADTVYLGTHALPGAQLLEALAALEAQATRRPELAIGAGSFVVGRDAACDRVVDAPVVSSRHARITRQGDGTLTVEDLHSANGTFINGRRIDWTASARPGDTIALGSYSLVLALDPALSVAPPTLPTLSPTTDTPPPGSFGSELAEAWRDACTPFWKPAELLILGPMAGVLVLMSADFGQDDSSVGTAWAACLSRLGTVAVGIGLIGGIGSKIAAPAVTGLRSWLARVSVPAVLCASACLMAWFACLRFSSAYVVGLLLLGSGVGIGIGLIAASLAPRPAVAWMVVALLLASIWLIGGEGTIWPKLPAWAKTAAAINPARWTFEGLMVNASDRLPVKAAESEPPTDLAEPYFPAETERVGPRGSALALVAMLLGFGAAAAFIATSPRPGPGPDRAGRPAP